MKHCIHCGSQINDWADVCIYCKTPCNGERIVTEQQKKNEGKKLAIVTAVILISVIIIVACYLYAEISFYDRLFDF